MRKWLLLGLAQMLAFWMVGVLRFRIYTPIPVTFPLGTSRIATAASWFVCVGVILVATWLAGQRSASRLAVSGLVSLCVFWMLQLVTLQLPWSLFPFFVDFESRAQTGAIALALWLVVAVESIGTAIIVSRFINRTWRTEVPADSGHGWLRHPA